MSKAHERVVEAQFGPRAKAYVESAVHSQGADLEAIAALAQIRAYRFSVAYRELTQRDEK